MRLSEVSVSAWRSAGKKRLQVGGEAAFVLADFVGDSNEEPVDAGDAASHLGRGGELQDAGADDDGDHVRGADDDERGATEEDVVAEAEDNGGCSEKADAGEHDLAGAVLDGVGEQGERDGEGSERRHGTEDAKAVGSGVQNIYREDGHERGGSAEQDGEEVERDGA